MSGTVDIMELLFMNQNGFIRQSWLAGRRKDKNQINSVRKDSVLSPHTSYENLIKCKYLKIFLI